MFRKLLSVSLVAVMLSVTAFANPELATLDASLTANAEGVFTYAESKITSVTEGDATHLPLAELTPWQSDEVTATPIADLKTTEIDGKTFYMITNGADLAGFANYVNEYTGEGADAVFSHPSANAILMNDINLNSKSWKNYRIAKGFTYTNSKGTTVEKQNKYTGIFDGNGHTIYEFYISEKSPAGGQGGLFRRIGTGAVVKNLNFENATAISTYTTNCTSTTYTSIVCGEMTGGTIQNVSVSGTIKVSGSGKYANSAGSIASKMTAGTIENCYSDVTINLASSGTNKTYDSSKYTAVGNYGVGGIVGFIQGTSAKTISQCGFEGTINAPYNARVAGIIGHMNGSPENLLIEKCYNTGDITGLRQVAGILGWANNGTYQKDGKIQQCYNTGNIVVKSATSSYAAGISNGCYGNVIKNNYSIGNVSVEETDKPSFNELCGLLFTCLYENNSNVYYSSATSSYCDDYSYENSENETVKKHSTATKKATYSEETPYTKAQFADGTALETLGTTNYTYLKGLNNGYPVLAWQATAPLTDANTYYVANDSLELALETAGYVTLEIAPLGESATVNGKTITEKGTYTLAATDAVTVTEGQALITIDLMNQTRAGSAVPALEATAIKAQLPAAADRIVILALYAQDNTLKNVVYEEAALAGEKVSAVIDLSDVNVAGCELRAYVWENGTLVPQANDDSYVLTSSAN